MSTAGDILRARERVKTAGYLVRARTYTRVHITRQGISHAPDTNPCERATRNCTRTMIMERRHQIMITRDDHETALYRIRAREYAPRLELSPDNPELSPNCPQNRVRIAQLSRSELTKSGQDGKIGCRLKQLNR